MNDLVFAVLTCLSLHATAGEIEDAYWSGPGTNAPGPTISWRLMSTNHGITAIGIERTKCFGTCPAYTFVIKSDGICRYKGTADVDFIGERVGRISPELFHELAWFIVSSGYWSMPDTYDSMTTDASNVYTMFAFGSRWKVFRDYARNGPSKIWALEQLIDGMCLRATWETDPHAKENPK